MLSDLKSYITKADEFWEKIKPADMEDPFFYDLITRNFNLNYDIINNIAIDIEDILDRETINSHLFANLDWYYHIADEFGCDPEDVLKFFLTSLFKDVKILFYVNENMPYCEDGYFNHHEYSDEEDPDEIAESIDEGFLHDAALMRDLLIDKLKVSVPKKVYEDLKEWLERDFLEWCGETIRIAIYCISSKILYEVNKNKEGKKLIEDFFDCEVINDDEEKISYIYLGSIREDNGYINDFIISYWDVLNKKIAEITNIPYSDSSSKECARIKKHILHCEAGPYTSHNLTNIIFDVLHSYKSKEEVIF